MLQSSSSEKDLVKPLKNCIFGPNFHKKEVIMGHAQFFLAEMFHFIKISYVLTELWIFFYLEWCFGQKKVWFPAKTALKQDGEAAIRSN